MPWLRSVFLLLPAVWLVTAAPLLLAGELGATVSATDLRERPFFDAPGIARYPPRTRVEILERRGGWMRVTISGREGWVRLLSVRLDSQSPQPVAGSWVSRLGPVSGQSRPAGAVSPTVTTGIRGLSVVELENARPDPAELKRMRAFRATPEQARAHAQAAGLSVFRVTAFGPDGRPLEGNP